MSFECYSLLNVLCVLTGSVLHKMTMSNPNNQVIIFKTKLQNSLLNLRTPFLQNIMSINWNARVSN